MQTQVASDSPRESPRSSGFGALRCAQIKRLDQGGHGLVQLCEDRVTGEQVAIKFIERGKQVRIAAWDTRAHAHNSLRKDTTYAYSIAGTSQAHLWA